TWRASVRKWPRRSTPSRDSWTSSTRRSAATTWPSTARSTCPARWTRWGPRASSGRDAPCRREPPAPRTDSPRPGNRTREEVRREPPRPGPGTPVRLISVVAIAYGFRYIAGDADVARGYEVVAHVEDARGLGPGVR